MLLVAATERELLAVDGADSVRHADRSLWRVDDALAALGWAVPRVVAALRG